MKRNFNILVSIATFIVLLCSFAFGVELSKENADLLKEANERLRSLTSELMFAEWEQLGKTDAATEKKIMGLKESIAQYTKELAGRISKIPWKDINDASAKRQFQKFTVIGDASLPTDKFVRRLKILSDMDIMYRGGVIFENLHDAAERKRLWLEGRTVLTKDMKKLFEEYVKLSNEAATLNGYSDYAELWLQQYEQPNFVEEIQSLLNAIKPLFQQIHAYVRVKLIKKYGAEVTSTGLIPHHLVSDMWTDVTNFTLPYPDEPVLDTTDAMVKAAWNLEKLFKTGEFFFTSMGLQPMTKEFWDKTMHQKPASHEVDCLASSWDFYDGKTYAIRNCFNISQYDLYAVHHQMGQIEYFMEYKNQPFVFRTAANPGFYSAIGDTVYLSVISSKYMRDLDLIKSTEKSHKSAINDLYSMALDDIALLPIAYTMDFWRWNVFKGNVKPSTYTCEWWKLYEATVGVGAPERRTEELFDAAAVYHTITDNEFIRHFVGTILRFQMHKAFCIEAKEYKPNDPNTKPLHECSISGNAEVGKRLKSLMQLGSSKSWQDALDAAIGQKKLDASGLLDYFKPLMTWLEEENKRTNAHIGWEPVIKSCN